MGASQRDVVSSRPMLNTFRVPDRDDRRPLLEEPRDSGAIIDGKSAAAALRACLTERLSQLTRRDGTTPGLAIILVGDDPASSIYVRQKIRASAESGVRCARHDLPSTTSTADLLTLIRELNADDRIDGILVQLPLPPSLDARQVLAAIDPDKDVDGLHTANVGRLATAEPGLVPCTAQGCMRLIRSVRPRLAGAHAVVVGRSPLVGRPLAQLLLRADCTVTTAHSKTIGLADICRTAGILAVAAGCPELVRGDWIRPGAIVIDAGINRVVDRAGNGRIVGDVAFAEAAERAGAITPVPGGVGPMTVACLLENVLLAACRRRGINPDEL